MLLLLDVLDHLGHVVLILAEFRRILKEFFVLLFSFFERNRFLFLLGDVRLLGLDLGIKFFRSNRLQFFVSRGDGAGAPPCQKGTDA